MQNSLRRRLRSDRLLFFFITRISHTLELLSPLQIHLQRDAASRWLLAVYGGMDELVGVKGASGYSQSALAKKSLSEIAMKKC